ncbi:MAG: hypothetical protein QW432_04085 [Desulfurococcaceae archaeon]
MVRWVYVLVQIALILACYVIPYTLLRHAKDLSLYLFWAVATSISILLAIIKLHTSRSGDVR